MLNVGPLELLVVLAVALIVVGPERLPELARSVGRVLRQFREVQDEVRDMVSSGVDDDMRQAADEFRKATGGIKRATDVKGAGGWSRFSRACSRIAGIFSIRVRISALRAASYGTGTVSASTSGVRFCSM